MINEVLQDPDVLLENVYNMDQIDTQEPEADTLLGLGTGPVADTPQPKAKRKCGPKSKNAVTEVVPPEVNMPEASIPEASIPEARDC